MESSSVYTKQQRIADLSRIHPGLSFTSLAYHIDMQWMREAYKRTRKDAATGVDGVTAKDYEEDLERNLEGLLERFKSGSYVAPPVRRTYLPKDDGQGGKRPIGIPTLEDKILQRAIVMVLEPLYEADFVEGSYGFRPKRNAHQALNAVWKGVMKRPGCWVLEVDIKSFFDTLKHPNLREMYKRRVSDGVICRVLGKWLKAGVLQDGSITHPSEGTPQGGVISPLLSNIYLHEVLDDWFEREISPLLERRAKLVRYADDFVLLFASERDAKRVEQVLWKRFSRYGLALHPEKTCLRKFFPPQEGEKPDTFDFLGFTHYWGKSRRGNWVVKRKTAKKRLVRAVRKMQEWCREHRHDPVKEQWQSLRRKIQGHYGYYGIAFNSRSLEQYLYLMGRVWHKWLSRRTRGKAMPWERFNRLLKRYPLPRPRIHHAIV